MENDSMNQVLHSIGMSKNAAWRQTEHQANDVNSFTPADHEPLHRSYNVMEGNIPGPNDALISSNRQWVCYLPFVGRVQAVRDAQGLFCSFIIILYWVYGNW